MNYEEALMAKVSWYYYIEGMTQQNISELLGISRMKVIKLLDKARESGIIQFSICKREEKRMSIENNLRDKFKLRDAFVVPTNPVEAETNETISKAAAMYIFDRISKDDFINIGYGDTTGRVLNNLAEMTDSPVSCVSLTGGVNCYLLNHPRVFNANLYLIPAPLIVSSTEIASQIKSENAVQEIERMASHSKMTVLGIGGVKEDATIVKSGLIGKNDLVYLQMQGAVGDILSHFIDENGKTVNAEIEGRLISYELEKVKELNNVIGVAAGGSKLEAIRAALLGEYLDVLITDEETAEKLINTP